MPFWELFSEDTILDQLQSNTKDDAFREMLDSLVATGQIQKKDIPALKRKLKDRERLATTGIGHGVAVPHVRSAQITQLSVCFARSVAGIDYHAPDGQLVHSIFLILAPNEASEDHVKLLRWISTIGRDPDFRRFALAARGRTEILSLLKEKSV
jgi:mannitol/fructose-specific phosphotransferase system IIA component (Ntr-type)